VADEDLALPTNPETSWQGLERPHIAAVCSRRVRAAGQKRLLIAPGGSRIPSFFFAEFEFLDKNPLLLEASDVSQADSKKTVLIVDDDEETRHVLRILCEADDELHVVGEAANGVEAVRLALNHRPSFIILDYRLPRLDGEGAAEILKAVTPGSKIVAFSALLDEQPEWADAYLNKDKITELMPLLRSFIR
jgi:CheY-like chemotaxis protein